MAQLLETRHLARAVLGSDVVEERPDMEDGVARLAVGHPRGSLPAPDDALDGNQRIGIAVLVIAAPMEHLAAKAIGDAHEVTAKETAQSDVIGKAGRCSDRFEKRGDGVRELTDGRWRHERWGVGRRRITRNHDAEGRHPGRGVDGNSSLEPGLSDSRIGQLARVRQGVQARRRVPTQQTSRQYPIPGVVRPGASPAFSSMHRWVNRPRMKPGGRSSAPVA